MLRNKILQALFFILLTSFGFSQEKFTLSGTLKDAKSNETIIGATIQIKNSELTRTIQTNEYGYYSISIPKGEYNITIQTIGYENLTDVIYLESNTKKDFLINEKSKEIEEVLVVSNNKSIKIDKPEMSVNKLTIAQIKSMPAILGEVDVIKSILTLPGVTNAGEGQSGFNVRGGAADQNLILLDEATIYNSSHLFGFFSVFNADAIKDLKLYKGGIPARFGGRVASVLDIYQKEGNSKNFGMTGGIGLISSRLLAEGPIVKDKGSFLVAGRSSYAHLFLKLANNNNSAYFYDLNTKLNYKLNDNNNLFLSGYFGRDVFSLNEQFINTYGNSVLNVRWNHLFNSKLFSNASFIYSDYYYGLTLDFIGFNWESGIKNYNFKYDFKHYLSDNFKLYYGANAIYYDFNPGRIEPINSESGINEKQLAKKYAFEPAFYLDAEQKLSSKLSVNYGLRYSMFYRLGEETINIYENNQAVTYDADLGIYEKATPIGTQYYGKNKTIASFDNFEPRIALAYTINEDQSIKASYNRMSQYLHLISNTQSPTPLDVWAPSDNFLKPQILDQFALGYFKNIKNGDYTLEVESFYKTVKNRLDYIDGADLIANEAIEQVLLPGKTRAYGLELMVKKNVGKLSGWISYTLSRSEQKTEGRTPIETGINKGEWYKTGWDKTHNLYVTGSYKSNEKWSFGSIFTYQTGQPITFPTGQYQYQGINVPVYGNRNEDNLPSYHRIDISATLNPNKNKGRKWQGEWVFSVYNLYGRKNAASINFRQNKDDGSNEAVKLSIFGIVPSVTYNFKF
ncbi:TonB-dependent receptor [Flavobacterium urocaniciphilum]|uniref:isocitrate dehydrogenase (NADP(+)) n=1 Tax=Flavobacterium urocaniciphilum TaxID=1299341 RepID=A0A1H8YUP6_9FLAO|nr:TonB-dependent receptor [Flavobacterium urocaniciphilum]SEP55803.1 TonB-dependent Receptor Plug Domain [Flavobacterium urocaniciphilum]